MALWSRRLFVKRLPLRSFQDLNPIHQEILSSRIEPGRFHEMKYNFGFEMVAWALMERDIFSSWLPGLSPEEEGALFKLETLIRQGGMRQDP